MSSPRPPGVRAGTVLIPEQELEETAARSGGPGGQHVNKTSTRITLRWSVRDSAVLSDDQRARLLEKLDPRLTRDGVLLVHADTTRSQLQNRELARERLAAIVATALLRPKPRRPTRPSRGSIERRIKSKKHAAARKRDRGSWPE